MLFYAIIVLVTNYRFRGIIKLSYEIITTCDTYRANPLIQATIGMNIIMNRTFTLALMQTYLDLDNSEPFDDFSTIQIPAQKVKEICGSNYSEYYRRLKKAINARQKDISVQKDSCLGERFIAIPIFDRITFDVKNGLVFKFNKIIAPYIAELKSRQYTKIAAPHSFALSSVYAVRILELLLEYKSIDMFKRKKIISRIVTIEDMRWFLGITDEKYLRTYDFVKKVIEYPISEINRVTPFNVKYESIFGGRTIRSVRLMMDLPKSDS